MKLIKRLVRFIRINFILAKYGLNSVVLLLKVFSPLRFLNAINPRNWFRKRAVTSNDASLLSLKDFKPLFSEMGKIFSNHQEIHPETIAQELNKLKSKVSPMINKKSGVIIEQVNEASPPESEAPAELITLKTEELGRHVKNLWNELSGQLSAEDVVHQLGSLVSRGKELKTQFIEAVPQNIAEYLQEELRIFPSRNELNDFFNEIDDLSLSVGRLQAHVNQLMSAHEIN
ncbi:hypothetical protein [Legionella maioricensis]|uniref:Uncharacterized protein n=1 Tax=Legionella maioricensis TaxID=2896528 RepID=A0A9X2IB23_9GAMM|nr:hypothetical protein [Legionella maioricensis]MCL9683017.1 hypothetical protein [Legionella maioricensis]MCL9686365.1 hypothetical protein [Legionella maioricensis]